MKVERIVQIHVAVLASIGAILLGMGQESSMLPVLAVFAAITSVIFTDTLNWFRLNRLVANLAMLFALVVCFFQFFQPNTRNQLLAIANLLIYLQITSFYQRKSDRIYWHLIVFSLLQVVVSATLNSGFEFGMMLILYITVAISTLLFFFIHREVCRVMGPGAGDGQVRSHGRKGKTVTEDESTWRQLLKQETVAAPVASPGQLNQQIVGRGFVVQIFATWATTLVFGVVLYYLFSALPGATGRFRRAHAKNVVGFSSEVTLNELTEVLQSNDAVMRIRFVDYQTRSDYRIFGGLYIRGSVLTEYVSENGFARWKQRSTGRNDLRSRIGAVVEDFGRDRKRRPLPWPPSNQKLILQDITREPIRESVAFAVFPAFEIGETLKDVRFDPNTQQIHIKSRQDNRMPREYSLGTTAFRGGLQLDIVPRENLLKSFLADHLSARLLADSVQHLLGQELGDVGRYLLEQCRDLSDPELAKLRRFDASRFPRLKQIADEIGESQRTRGANRVTLARALRDHFQDPELYNYSLDLRSIPRNKKLDPIEDFVANPDHRTGHCEYFASALAMMLRSQGIPSRLVVGFKPTEYNEVGGYYQVLQRDAHAWVEAYLSAEDIIGQVPEGTYISPGGGWLRLEPTLGAADHASSEYERGWIDVMDDVLDYARVVWTDYILGVTAKRQRNSIYSPTSRQADTDSWTAFVDTMAKKRDAIMGWLRRNVLSGRGLAIVALLAAVSVGLHLLTRAVRPKARRVVLAVQRWTSRLVGQTDVNWPTGRAQQVVEFYQRFERLLGRLGLARGRGQTQREFAAQAARRLADDSHMPSIDGLKDQIVDAFYRVRFGQATLAEHETKTIETGLSRLEEELVTRNQTRSNS